MSHVPMLTNVELERVRLKFYNELQPLLHITHCYILVTYQEIGGLIELELFK
jgi:hypothetical protein